LGYFGFTKIKKSGASVEVFGLEIDALNESEKQQGYMLLGLSVVMFIGGIYTSGKK
jgi:radical SAM superfamily enzyme with C-terminal helix-hairpin-helix motif